MVQADLLRVGLHARLRGVSYSTFLQSVETRHTVQAAFTGWMQDFPDPSDFAEILFHSRNATDTGAQNQSFYRNPELDALLDRAHIELSRERRLEMYRQAERIIVADAPWAFMYNPTNTEVVQPYVHGYRIHPVYTFDIGGAWLDLPLQRYARDAARPHSVLAALIAPFRSFP
jgi:ABC-type transport system substrate-binding protein